jgi:hypothetical protein
VEIKPVNKRSELKRFINFPYRLHRTTHNWIPPLRIEQKKIFNPSKNSILQKSDYQLYLLYNREKIIGRIAAHINHHYNEHWKEKTGFFGHYECIEDQEAANLLLTTAENWLRERGMRVMRGQWNFVSQDFGFVYEGFDVPPSVLSSYNPAYYNDQMLRCGMKKAKDLLVYSADVSSGYQIPDRFLKFTDAVAKRYGVKVRTLNMNDIVGDARIMVRLSNESLAGNWGVFPIDESEAEEIAANLKPIIHPDAVLIAETEKEPIGYLIGIPDINHLLQRMNGRLFPTGIFRLLLGVKKLRRYRIWAMGIIPAYQKKGISILLFRKLNDALAQKSPYVEANYVLEDNHLMNNALKNLKFDLVKKYRVYEKAIG